MNEKNNTVRMLNTIIDNLGDIKEILNNEDKLAQIIDYEDKHILIVLSDIINHNLRTEKIIPEDLGLLRNINFITICLNKYFDNKEEIFKIINYLSNIENEDVQIALYTNPIVIIYFISEDIINMDNIRKLKLDTRLKIVEELIKYNYNKKALETIQNTNKTLEFEREYYEYTRKKIPNRW